MSCLLMAVWVFLAVASACAQELSVGGVQWHERVVVKGRVQKHPIGGWVHQEKSRGFRGLTARVEIRNEGPEQVEGVLVRYAFRPGIGLGKEELAWIPFYMEELRVPRLRPREVKWIWLPSVPLTRTLRTWMREGIAPAFVQLELGVFPRGREQLQNNLLVVRLPISYEPHD